MQNSSPLARGKARGFSPQSLNSGNGSEGVVSREEDDEDDAASDSDSEEKKQESSLSKLSNLQHATTVSAY